MSNSQQYSKEGRRRHGLVQEMAVRLERNGGVNGPINRWGRRINQLIDSDSDPFNDGHLWELFPL
jgi:hypothetical protein